MRTLSSWQLLYLIGIYSTLQPIGKLFCWRLQHSTLGVGEGVNNLPLMKLQSWVEPQQHVERALWCALVEQVPALPRNRFDGSVVPTNSGMIPCSRECRNLPSQLNERHIRLSIAHCIYILGAAELFSAFSSVVHSGFLILYRLDVHTLRESQQSWYTTRPLLIKSGLTFHN